MTTPTNSLRQKPNIGQEVRSFVVQIRRLNGEIEGTGFAVQHDPGLIVTCRHVVEDANGVCELGARVKIYFPQIRHGKTEDKTFSAEVIRQLDTYEDDAVVLQLISDEEDAKPISLPSDVKIAYLGDAMQSTLHRFRSYGFPDRDKYQAAWIDGEIAGHIDKPDDSNLHSEPVQLRAVSLAPGVSGAPVWDKERNLVVGIIAELYDPAYGGQVTDGYAVDGVVLSLESLGLPLYPEYQYPMTESQPIDEKVQATVESVAPQINFPLAPTYRPTQPPELPEWAGRVELLGKLDQDYADSSVNITGLIGFGGEGKSSIAYRWLTKNALTGEYQPDASFWWSFYENRSFEQMVEGLIEYLYGEQNLERIKGMSQRVNFIGAMALTRRLILVLDGFEVMQEEDGDKFGTLPNKDMVRLLELFGQSRKSFCLVTSRVPLMDFINHTAYVQRDVTRLTPEDGRDLLRKLGVDGEDDQLDPIVGDWEGHALTVSLVGSYLREQEIPVGKYNKEDTFPKVEAYQDEVPRYRQVRRILERYDENLTEADKAFLKLFSVFRLPVPESAFGRVFRADTGSTLNTDLHGLDDAQFEGLITHLVERRLIRKAEDKGTITYNAHPLVQRHYRKALEDEHKNTDVQPIHKVVAEHYKETSDRPSRTSTLDDLKPYIEVVHHLCQAGAYDEGFDIFRDHIYQGNQRIIWHILGAFETALSVSLEFFTNNDPSQEPQISTISGKGIIINDVGFCLKSLGKLREATSLYERATTIYTNAGNHHHASIGYQNIASLYLQQGNLAKMQTSGEQALIEAQQVYSEQNRINMERFSFGCLAYAKHLRGQIKEASDDFKIAEGLEIENDSSIQYLYGNRGIWHTEHLQRIGETDYARRMTQANLKICQGEGWIPFISQCHRVLGDLNGEAGNHQEAEGHYEKGLAIAGQIDTVDIKIEAWLARGRWLAKCGKGKEAMQDLETALGMAENSGYRIYEADIRVAMAWAYKARGDIASMGREAGQALAMSVEMGYHWGQVDAREVLG